MLSSSNNRVQAIKSKFESLNSEKEELLARTPKQANVFDRVQLCKQNTGSTPLSYAQNDRVAQEKENKRSTPARNGISSKKEENNSSKSTINELTPQANCSYLYNKLDTQKTSCDNRKLSLTRQTSDPGKKLHRSHAFRCDKTQKIGGSPKRHGSCNGRSETSDYTLKTSEKPKLSKDRLKRLGNLLEDKMKKENFAPKLDMNNETQEPIDVPYSSIPDDQVPKHILDQYAKVLKPKKRLEDEFLECKQDPMTDSGVSSETEELSEKGSRLKQLKAQFEAGVKTEISVKPAEVPLELVHQKKSNLDLVNNELCSSSETMRLERKNPHVDLTDTLKKALKQPLPMGPPPKKPPRTFTITPVPKTDTGKRKDTKQMLEKLEQVLQKREAKTSPPKNLYDIAETDLSHCKPKNKEIHYLCTEILDITNRTLLPNNQNITESLGNCFNSLNCSFTHNRSTSSLPYTRLSLGSIPNRNSLMCCSCSSDSLEKTEENRSRFSTFFAARPEDGCCKKCHSNFIKTEGFQCHIDCKCSGSKSEFFLPNTVEHIYDVPNTERDYDIPGSGDQCGVVKSMLRKLEAGGNPYATVNGVVSKSLEDLRSTQVDVVEKIYDVPCNESRSQSPAPESFESLRMGFENTTIFKPGRLAKPSGPKVTADGQKVKRSAAESRLRRYERNAGSGLSLTLARRDRSQLDVDRENLNRLMNEIYETVSAACRMDEQQQPSRFPLDQSDGTSSEDSVKLTRSLTEKRKNYVRRVSSRAAYLDNSRYRHQTSVCSYKSETPNPYSTFRSWKSFRNSQSNLSKSPDTKMVRQESSDSKTNLTDSHGNLLSMRDDLFMDDSVLDSLSLDDKAGCVNIDLPFDRKERGLFDVCLLVGLNYLTGRAYVKSVFPNQVTVPPHIENLVFPETLSLDESSKPEYDLEASRTQCYSLVLTNEKGERNYGYCRRVLPEGATCCLPLCYCIIGGYRAPGFYYKVLQEIESHHGSTEVEIHMILRQLFDTEFPNPGEEIRLSYPKRSELAKSPYRNSVNLGDVLKCKTLPENFSARIPEFCSDNGRLRAGDSESSFVPNKNNSRSQELGWKVIKRPLEPRTDEDNLSVLLDSLGAGLLIKVFGSLLLERKVVLISDNLSQLSSCMEALQAILYPFVWQQPLISTIPSELRKDILEAPLPILAGMLKRFGATEDSWETHMEGIGFEEGMLIDVSGSAKVIFCLGDEGSLLPPVAHKTLKTALQLERRERGRARNALLAEAFLRFFVDVLHRVGDYVDVEFKKEEFIQDAPSKHVQYFLEWFTESAMFNHFVQNVRARREATPSPATPPEAPPPAPPPAPAQLVDAPLPNFYELFEERVTRKETCRRSAKTDAKCDTPGKTNYRNAMNKRVRLLKNKLRDLVN